MIRVSRDTLLLTAEGAGPDDTTVVIRGYDIWGASETRMFKATVLSGSAPLDNPIFLSHASLKKAMPFPGVYALSVEADGVYASIAVEQGTWRARLPLAAGAQSWAHYDAILSAVRSSRSLRSLTVRAGDLLRAAAMVAHGVDDPDEPVTLYLPDETLPLIAVRQADHDDERVAAVARLDDRLAQEPRLWRQLDVPRLDELVEEERAERKERRR